MMAENPHSQPAAAADERSARLSDAPLPAGMDAPEAASDAELDRPVDAIVYAVHPAMGRIAGGDYPYAARGRLPPAQHEPLAALTALEVGSWLLRGVERYFAALQSPPDFVVPKTFGMSAILGLMTVLAMLFACLRWLDSYPVFYFFFSVEAIAICLAQMLYGKAPRVASIAAGAIILPLFTLVMALLSRPTHPALVCLAVGFIPFGAILGYLTGTCAAGIFLVMERLEPYLQGRGRLRETVNS